MSTIQAVVDALLSGGDIAAIQAGQVKVYPRSLTEHEGDKLLVVKDGYTKKLIVTGTGALASELQGEAAGNGAKVCPLSHENRLVLNRHLPWTAPRAFGTQIATIGLGDRLGVASQGHIQTVRGRDIRPILAQQSIRELNLTGRDYKEVLDAACYAALEEGYRDGFGADGDHLKVEADIQMSLDLGFTMLTLDCSEKIDNTIEGLSEAEVAERYAKLPADVRAGYESRYEGKTFDIGSGVKVEFSRLNVMKNALIYGEAVGFMKYVYETYITKAGREVDFEISIDETLTPTEPHSHFFVANELYNVYGMTVYSMAPRFCGEFQKGIDYIGDIAQFEEEMKIHAAIADHFGFKLSIHSGSDKFSVFPIIGKYTKGRFHAKTAGTNWLEAVRTVAKVNPDLYRRMHAYAIEHFEEATAYYHVKADITTIKPLSEVSDADLPEYMNDDDARQMIHITYGILLQAKDEKGGSLFKDEFYRTLSEQEEQYADSLRSHIGKHLDLLGK
ncbi:tagaturonate epimerase family protein [Paenibacillus turpanensis]|uniref:tagaturonate epimerase family protein n=1 Tax=Paenibacillus turpanensis TaxID=2689078 RepID=UPI00140A70E8|nr:tagaturonate epimerase family protein [Paenibacillus turpanensis]